MTDVAAGMVRPLAQKDRFDPGFEIVVIEFRRVLHRGDGAGSGKCGQNRYGYQRTTRHFNSPWRLVLLLSRMVAKMRASTSLAGLRRLKQAADSTIFRLPGAQSSDRAPSPSARRI